MFSSEDEPLEFSEDEENDMLVSEDEAMTADENTDKSSNEKVNFPLIGQHKLIVKALRNFNFFHFSWRIWRLKWEQRTE